MRQVILRRIALKDFIPASHPASLEHPSTWTLSARHYVGERHPLISLIYLGLALGSFLMGAHLHMGTQVGVDSYPAMLCLSLLMGAGASVVTYLEARPLFAPAPTEYLRLLDGQRLHPKAKGIVESRKSTNSLLRGIDLWLVLVIQLRWSRIACV